MDSNERPAVPVVAITRRIWEFLRALFRGTSTAPKPPEPPLDVEYFRPVLDLLNGTTKSALVTGKAGTGKSTFLRYFVANTGKRLVVLAPTGLAALNVKGQTIHAFFKFKPGLLEPEDLRFHPLRAHLYRAIDALVIDEVSMVRVDLMNAIDLSLRRHRGNSEPFGGVQLILIGDLFQLPPVTPDQLAEHCVKKYGGPYFFNAPVFASGFNLACFELSRVMRQQSRPFVDLLGRVRIAAQTDEDLIRLHDRHVSVTGPAPDAAVVLTTTNPIASRINRAGLAALPGDETAYEAVLSGSLKATYDRLLLKCQGNPDQLERALETSFPVSIRLTLKPGAKLIMIKNDSRKRWVNGSLVRLC